MWRLYAVFALLLLLPLAASAQGILNDPGFETEAGWVQVGSFVSAADTPHEGSAYIHHGTSLAGQYMYQTMSWNLGIQRQFSVWARANSSSSPSIKIALQGGYALNDDIKASSTCSLSENVWTKCSVSWVNNTGQNITLAISGRYYDVDDGYFGVLTSGPTPTTGPTATPGPTAAPAPTLNPTQIAEMGQWGGVASASFVSSDVLGAAALGAGALGSLVVALRYGPGWAMRIVRRLGRFV